MSPIHRGTGNTESERFLAQIAEKSFLNLWTYANVFRDQHINGSPKGDGKELCDVLVVCGDDVIIFSDKTVKWCADKATNIAWCRWYKAAIEKSADQIHGAARWLREHPRRVFIDNACTVPLPIALPPPERMRVHGVVIAIGANEVIIAGGGHHLGIRGIDWKCEDLIADVSRSETLHPGEFFGSGTVGNGCGLESMRFLKHGDVVELEVEGIGILRNRVQTKNDYGRIIALASFTFLAASTCRCRSS